MALLEACDRNARVTLRAPYPYDIVLGILLERYAIITLSYRRIAYRIIFKYIDVDRVTTGLWASNSKILCT